jgi:multiple antibiotic resistance protein
LSDADETIPGTNVDISVFPMAIPMLAGPGAIASIMLFMSEAERQPVRSADGVRRHGREPAALPGLFLAIGPIMKIIGDTLAAMITRILGVILAALAAQFIFDGIRGRACWRRLIGASLRRILTVRTVAPGP